MKHQLRIAAMYTADRLIPVPTPVFATDVTVDPRDPIIGAGPRT